MVLGPVGRKPSGPAWGSERTAQLGPAARAAAFVCWADRWLCAHATRGGALVASKTAHGRPTFSLLVEPCPQRCLELCRGIRDERARLGLNLDLQCALRQ